MHENDPEVLEREKQRNLKRGTIDLTSTPHEHAPGWNEALASASEAIVKAEKSGGDPQTLQKVTVNYLKKGRVNSDNESSTTAYYSKDEVTGPLKTAEGKNGKEDFVVKQGKVLEDEEGPNTIQKSLKEKTK
ncbi:hypothetical protein BJ912DRAFT_538813 [Pholiota molesta]|nr:hypothetical protein BJ912DRAFT_538813 [Pholiota molesta]